ncbi:MAG TPA: AAA family ATPase, partial [Acidimicrobiales bacterium]|nr:AAA family ATPase [Acidimicrobiales bacterium]
MRLPANSLVVLIGPSGAGKSHWAATSFRADQVVSTDGLRALVGTGPGDQRAGTDAFDLLDVVLDRRLGRGLLTVVDSLGLDPDRRRRYLEAARRHGFSAHAVVFDTPAEVCRARNRSRPEPVPSKVLTAQLAARDGVLAALVDEGFDGVHQPGPVDVVPAGLLAAPDHAAAQVARPVALEFGLHLSSFSWGPGPPLADRLAEV